MWRTGTGLVIGAAGFLIGCGVSAPLTGGAGGQTAPGRLTLASLPPATPAWGERIAVTDAQIRKLRVNLPGGPVVVTLGTAPQLVDLPAPPLSAETWGSTSSVSLETYRTRLSSAVYTRRASVEFLNGAGQVMSTLYPYGAVNAGQLEFLVSTPAGGCPGLFTNVSTRLAATGISGFMIKTDDLFSVSVDGRFDLCHAVVLLGQQAAQAGVTKLDQVLSQAGPKAPVFNDLGYVSDRLTVMNLMQGGGAYAYDPTCDEVQNKLDPVANNGFSTVSMTKLGSDLNTASTALSGRGVSVAVIGGGMGAQDNFDCRPGYAFAKHDTHIGNLIRTLAQNVTLRDLPVCNAAGTCRSSSVSRALMNVLALNPAPQLVNMSLGGPLPNRVMYELVELLGTLRGTQVVTSSGNSPAAPAQYPASYARGVAGVGEPTLNNVISVAALGWKGSAYQIAGFNTRQNANLFAPGVSLCPTIVLNQRCLTQPYPQNLGISGTSFATPIVTALSALLIEQTGRMPADLLACLNRNLKTDPISNITYPAVSGQLCP